MGELITFSEREIKPKGAKKGSSANLKKLREYFFKDEYNALELLKHIPPFPASQLRVLYPGCGSDILTPLLYLESLFPNTQKAHCIFVDVYDNSGLIKTILDEVGIPFSAHKDKIQFYWRNVEVELEFRTGNIFELISSLEAVDVYFERAFRIMKDDHKDYEQKILDKLNVGGILISDSGFKDVKLKRIEVPKELSAYGEMVMGIKEK